MYRIAICDDEAPARAHIAQMLSEFAAQSGKTFECAQFASANDLLRDYHPNWDMVFLDISMPGMDGMSAARQIRLMDSEVLLIFVTSMQQYALEGYSVRAFGFVTKPFKAPEFLYETEAALRQIDARRMTKSTIVLRSRNRMDRLVVSDILYCEVENHSVRVRLYGEDRQYRYQMKELESMLERYGFFRPHSSYLVNHLAIQQVGQDTLLLKDGTIIPISRTRRKAFLAQMVQYMGEQV